MQRARAPCDVGCLSPANLSQTAPAVTAVSTHAGAEQRRLVQVARAGLGAASEACVGSAAAWRRDLTLPAPGLGPSLQPGFLSLLPSFQTPHARTPPFFKYYLGAHIMQ